MERQNESNSAQDQGGPRGFLAKLASDTVGALLAETVEALILAVVFLLIMVFMMK